jgi:hypothetical protein
MVKPSCELEGRGRRRRKIADGRCVNTICEIVLAISAFVKGKDNSTVLMGPILLEIAEANIFEAAANASVTDIMVPRSPGAGLNFPTIK